MKIIFLKKKSSRNTKIIATIGKKIAKLEIAIALPVSTVAKIGFAKPPVVAVEVTRVVVVAPCTIDAVPPPAIIAKAQVKIGDKSVTVETITNVPAIAASGIAMVSNKLSNQGIK